MRFCTITLHQLLGTMRASKYQNDIIMKSVKVCKEDILRIGYDAIQVDGVVHILTIASNANTDKIILRSILACFGDYIVVDIIDSTMPDAEDDDVEIVTNLPWDKYIAVENNIK